MVLAFFISLAYSFAQMESEIVDSDLVFEKFELPGGPVGNSVQAIIQDSLGYMWFASQGGLHRYDGSNFITYISDPVNQNTLNSDYIEEIYLDSKGMIWLTHWTGGGLTSYNPDQESFTRYTTNPEDPESIMPGETGAIIEDSKGDIWVGGRQGLSRLNMESGKFKRYSHDPNDPTSLSDNDVRGLYVDSEGTLWVATGMAWDLDGEGGLSRYDA
ncbi:MAG: two-component regulator propeller domain-containing protein, partial [Robiginitalea sp.]